MADLTRSSIKALAARGLTLSQVADVYGVPMGVIYATLAAGRPAKNSLAARGEKLSKIRALRRQGLTVSQIARRLGMTEAQVSREISFARDPRQNPRPPKDVDIEAFRAFAEDPNYTPKEIAEIFEVSTSWVSKKHAELKITDLINAGLTDADIAAKLNISPNTVARVSAKVREPVVRVHVAPEEIADAAMRLSGALSGDNILEYEVPTIEQVSAYLETPLFEDDFYAGKVIFLTRVKDGVEKFVAARKAAEYRAERLAKIEVPDLDLDEIKRLRVVEQYYPEGIAYKMGVSLDELKLFLKSQGYNSIRDIDREALPSFDEVAEALKTHKTQLEAAKSLGITQANVRSILKAGGVDSVKALKGPSTPDFDIRKIAMLRTRGKTSAEVARELRTTPAKLAEFLRSKGLSIRSVQAGGFASLGKRTMHPSEVIRVHEQFGLDMEGGSRALKVDPYTLRAMYTWLDLPVGEIKPRRTNPEMSRASLVHKGGAFGVAGGASVAISKLLDTRYPDMGSVKRSLISGGVPAGVSLGVYAQTKNEAALWGLAGSVVGAALSAYLFKK